jgi:hypothetical protein
LENMPDFTELIFVGFLNGYGLSLLHLIYFT